MTDNEKTSSKEELNRDPVFYYSREHRLNRASPAVRAMFDEKPARSGLGRSLFATKANTMLFISVVLICFMFFMASRFTFQDQSPELLFGGNTLVLNIQRAGDFQVLEIIKRVPPRGEFYTGELLVTVSPVRPNESDIREGDFFSQYIIFRAVESETFRLPLPFEANDFFVVLENVNERRAFRLNID